MRRALIIFQSIPHDFDDLRAAAEREGFDFLGRLRDRWNGRRYLDDDLATMCGAVSGAELIAIGAHTFDEYDPSPLHRRIRHFYVRPDCRRSGIGTAVAEALINEAQKLAPVLHLRAMDEPAATFWESVGFARVEGRADRTHVLARG